MRIRLDDAFFPTLPSSASSDSGEEDQKACLTPSPPKGLKSPTKLSPVKRQRSRSEYASDTMKGNIVLAPGAKTIYTAGRPPWYDSEGQLTEPFVIGLCGGSASGKTTVARMIIEALDVQWVGLISMDSFYKVLSEEQHLQANINKYNFDHPDAFDFDLLIATLKRLREGKSVDLPIYNFTTHGRDKNTKRVYGSNVVIVEGIMLFANAAVLKLLDLKIFVDTDADIRLARRLKRDITERGRDINGVLQQYNTFVKPAFDQIIAPTMKHADIVVPRGAENEVAVNLIVMHVNNQLRERGNHVRSKMVNLFKEGQKLPDSLLVLPSSRQVQGLHTFIRNKDTKMDEFTFYSNRLMRLLIEYALSHLPFREVTVETPQGVQYNGKRLDAKGMCGVSILRAGETMEPALLEVCKEIRMGKILIQTNLDTGEPELHYLRLPRDIKDSHVLLLDATVATGAAAIMAIRVLLEHDVPEVNIMLLSLLMAAPGAHSVAYAFPRVKIITSAVDWEINDKFYIIPGIGNFGDRYFGTEPFVTND